MLARLVMSLAARGLTVSVLARDSRRLQEVVRRAPGRVVPWSADYQDDAALRSSVSRAVRENGQVRLCVCWIHEKAPRALEIVAREVAAHDGGRACDFYEVVGGATSDPSTLGLDRARTIASIPGVDYRRVVLGAHDDGSWLSDTEISDGVLAAVQQRSHNHIVGSLSRWRTNGAAAGP